nr:hypothetical protein CFP56_54198 [Quercus suber]
MVANLRDTLYGIFEEYKNSTSDICNMVEVASSSGGVHGHYVKGSYFKMAIASIVHLYVFPAKPYELMGTTSLKIFQFLETILLTVLFSLM